MPATAFGNKVFGSEHSSMVEAAQKEVAEKSFDGKLRNLGRLFARKVANSQSGCEWFSIDDLDKARIRYASTMEAGRLIDRMRDQIKRACFARGDYWYEVTLEDANWEIGIYRLAPKS